MGYLFRRGMLGAALLAFCAVAPASDMPSLSGGTQWLQSSPLHRSELKGKVVLVDFWEYTCLNCLRTLPYLREWYKRYRQDGFEIVGVQTPEFTFSGQGRHVERGVKELSITWPVVVDEKRTIWNRFGINVWPTELLFDQTGHLVAQHVGEGEYPQMEAKIQALLRRRNPHLKLPAPMALLPQDSYDKPGAVCYPHTPEILVEQTPIADAPSSGNPLRTLLYEDRGNHKEGAIYLDGYWRASKEAVISDGSRTYFDVPYKAIQVTVVMTPAGAPARVDITQDGKPLARADAGADVRYGSDGMSYVTVDASRSYDVVMNAAYGAHDLRISPQNGGVAVYDVDFESCEVPGARSGP